MEENRTNEACNGADIAKEMIQSVENMSGTEKVVEQGRALLLGALCMNEHTWRCNSVSSGQCGELRGDFIYFSNYPETTTIFVIVIELDVTCRATSIYFNVKALWSNIRIICGFGILGH